MEKILHITRQFKCGGISNYIMSLSANTRGCCHFVYSIKDEQIDGKIIGTNNLILLPYHGFGILKFVKLLCFIKKNNINIIQSHYGLSNLLGFALSALTKTKFIVTEHGIIRNNKWYVKLSDFICLNLSSCIIVNSLATKNAMLNKIHISNKKKIRLIYPVFSSYKQNNAGQIAKYETKTLVCCGVLNKIKRFDSVIDLFYSVLQNTDLAKNNLQLIIIGDGEEKERLQAKVMSYNISAHVNFTGLLESNSVLNILNRCHLFVHLSKTEGFGLVLIEALACGLPIFASNVDAIPEIVENGVNGILVDDVTGSLTVDVLNQVISDDEMLEKFSKNNIEKFTKVFNFNRIIEEYEKLYTEIGNCK